MLTNYKPFIERVIQRYEGGYGWDANDRGGPTKYGITCYDLAEHRHEHMDSMVRWAPLVQAMTMTEAGDIYANKYATACDFADLDSGADCVVLDFGINSGPSRAVKFSQRIVGVAQDGVLGPVTRSAINQMNAVAFVNALCGARLSFLHGLQIWSVFGKGWGARVMDLREYAMNLIHPPAKTSTLGYTDKLQLIPLAFAKGYLPGDQL